MAWSRSANNLPVRLCERPPISMRDAKQLEQPPWSALTSTHAALALGNALARRYPPDIAPMVGIREVSAACLDALAALMRPGDDIVGLFGVEPVPASGDLVVVDNMMIEQMDRYPDAASLSRPSFDQLDHTLRGAGAGPVQKHLGESVAQEDTPMPITASINRRPESENQSQTAAPHPEEMKAEFDLRVGYTVALKASVRTTPAGLIGAALLATAILWPTVCLARTLLRQRP